MPTNDADYARMSDQRFHAIALVHATETARAGQLDQIRAQVVGLSVGAAGFIVTFARSADRTDDAVVFLIGLAIAAYLVCHRIGLKYRAHRAHADALADLAAQMDPGIATAFAPDRHEVDVSKTTVVILGYSQTWDAVAFGVPLLAALALVI
ncbi:MAG: hypothetical protein AAFV19_04640 [Pseudomonadota bacterium]